MLIFYFLFKLLKNIWRTYKRINELQTNVWREKKNKKVNIFYQNSFHCLENSLWLGFPFLLATPLHCQAAFHFDIADLLLA